jgi:hypothetical protein
MFFAILLVVIAATLHLVLGFTLGLAVIAWLFGAGLLWVLWKLRWVIAAVIGLEWLFGSSDSNS